MLKISPILSHIRKPIYTGHNTTCPLKPLQKDVFTRSGEISFSSLQAPTEEEIREKTFFETKVSKKNNWWSNEYNKPVSVYLTEPREECQETLPGYLDTSLYELENGEEPRELGILMCLMEKVDDKPIMYVCLLEKSRDAREYKGIGTALLKSALKISKSKGAEGRMHLSALNLDPTINESHPALFYYKHGFRCFDKAMNKELAYYLKEEEKAKEENKSKKRHQGFQYPDSIEMYLPKEHIEALERYNEADKDFLRHNVENYEKAPVIPDKQNLQ